MEKKLIILFLCFSFSVLAQQNTKDIYILMDKTASVLKEKSKANSISIGVVKNGKTYTRHYGEIDKGKENIANNNTVFEVASITKLFTGLLTAQAVLEGKLNPDDDIRKYISGSYPNLEYNGKPITVKDLVSFRTGFNKDLPDNDELRKNRNDSSYLAFKKIDESYTKEKFFEDLKTIKLDTLPGTKFKYSNGSLNLTAHILENVYKKSYETLLKENIFSKLNMTSTGINLDSNTVIANGYNLKGVRMPGISDNLWGAAGKLKSTLSDLTKFIAYELNNKNKIVQESQRNLLNSSTTWNGYFWDYIEVDENGKNCWKHGGAFGTQNMLLIYPERQLGISIIVNISDENTGNALGEAIIKLSTDLLSENKKQSGIYGYKIVDDKVVFTYEYDKSLNPDLVKTVSIAGSFDNWNPNDKNYQMIQKNKNTFELAIPKSQFEKDKTYLFKFVINKTGWMEAPKNVINREVDGDENLILKI
ncbi:CubicO group peptidase (beta-lactamase class C family) [Flavobacterium cutihirudinis]|uniref:CubicO group peptidase (Beta-lactamase class C family) n=1 Tax=Flavobacterium cutihirudinis TaxID=1265740 RepID=A0A3D9G1Z5_9FLAO|nr:serine hydrolase [Flavobacterium cutihirudinis]RED27235.1 CubicO group peptidase (beta-lactamase class C family) [Flavobacterium cutihirudinis]